MIDMIMSNLSSIVTLILEPDPMESNWSWLFLIVTWKLKYYVVKSLLVDKSQYKKNFLDHARSFVMQMGYFQEDKRQWCNDFLGTAWNHWSRRKPNQMVPSPKY